MKKWNSRKSQNFPQLVPQKWAFFAVKKEKQLKKSPKSGLFFNCLSPKSGLKQKPQTTEASMHAHVYEKHIALSKLLSSPQG